VVAERGPGGGVELDRRYRNDLSWLTGGEGQPPTHGPAGGRVHVDLTGWFHPVEPVPALPSLFSAVSSGRRIRFTHAPYDGEARSRVVSPLGLVVKAGIWYLVAGTASGLRVFRVSRIDRPEILEAQAARPERFDLAAFWAQWAAAFEAGRRRLPVTVRIDPESLARLRSITGDPGRVDAASAPEEDGLVRATVEFESDDQAISGLLSLGGAVEALGPAGVREAVARGAAAAARRYAPSDR
jgi:predicted DNA-binding transcriptional regulator YafY